MIRVVPRAEPAIFDSKVRLPGNEFLTKVPRPTAAEWKAHAYWTRVLDELHSSYDQICAYTCHWIAVDTGSRTVEHFLPKSKYTDQAYEWTNYRLVCGRLNARKGDDDDMVLDPFVVEDHWFTMEFPSLLVKPGAGLPSRLTVQIDNTIKKLKLNAEGPCMKARVQWVRQYCSGKFGIEFLSTCAPFIARELKRQGLVEKIRELWSNAV